jgi:hypothetical protein
MEGRGPNANECFLVEGKTAEYSGNSRLKKDSNCREMAFWAFRLEEKRTAVLCGARGCLPEKYPGFK